MQSFLSAFFLAARLRRALSACAEHWHAATVLEHVRGRRKNAFGPLVFLFSWGAGG